MNYQVKCLLEKEKIKVQKNKRKIGIIGELIAEKYLKSKRYKIICKNFFTRHGEIDIVSKKDNCIVFVEVKMRNNLNYGTPASAVNYIKLKHMKTAAKIFLTLNKCNKYAIRFDVIEILNKDGKYLINHIKQVI